MALSLKAFWNWVTIRLQKPKRQWGFSAPRCGGGAVDGVAWGVGVASDIFSRASCGKCVSHRRCGSSGPRVAAAGINLPGDSLGFNEFRESRWDGGVRGVPRAGSGVGGVPQESRDEAGEGNCRPVIRAESMHCAAPNLACWLQLSVTSEVCQ